ncbi:MAG: hypothetical protein SFX18_17550 [Pirellulales bacterium]|nr:hypothetical protein [Pirellulales bacterium]
MPQPQGSQQFLVDAGNGFVANCGSQCDEDELLEEELEDDELLSDVVDITLPP